MVQIGSRVLIRRPLDIEEVDIILVSVLTLALLTELFLVVVTHIHTASFSHSGLISSEGVLLRPMCRRQ